MNRTESRVLQVGQVWLAASLPLRGRWISTERSLTASSVTKPEWIWGPLGSSQHNSGESVPSEVPSNDLARMRKRIWALCSSPARQILRALASMTSLPTWLTVAQPDAPQLRQ